METMTLWTTQVPEVWGELQASGIYYVKEEYIQKKNGEIADYYLELYRWYTKEAGNYTDIPGSLQYPIWLCVSETVMLQPTEGTIILKLEEGGTSLWKRTAVRRLCGRCRVGR